MNVSIEIGLLVSAFLIFCSILMSKTGYRFGIPTLLMFLLAGMLFGTDGLGIQFDDVSVAQHIGMVALCIILFTGGMDTKMEDIRPVLSPGVMLATSGVFLTTLFLRIVRLLGFRLATAYGRRFHPHRFLVTGRHDVVHRLRLRLQHPSFAANQPET